MTKPREKSELTQLERNVLYMLHPHDNGLDVEIRRFRPDVLATLRALAVEGFCAETVRDDENTHFKLTDQGERVIAPYGTKQCPF